MSNIITGYRDRQALLVTKHGKEKVIAPLFYQRLGIRVESTKNIDTDALGTFSGEIERPGNQVETLRAKVRQGYHFKAFDLFIASEGSFNPHPDSPFITLNIELVLFVDRQLDLEIMGMHSSVATNFQNATINNLDELLIFLKKVDFPNTGVILKHWDLEGKLSIKKDFENISQVIEAGLAFCQNQGKTEIETDLRAHKNPLRMDNIRQATCNLLDEICFLCPQCGTPGFALSKKLPGLPCALCRLPTQLPYIEIRRCSKCNHTAKTPILNPPFADPQFCNYCNP